MNLGLVVLSENNEVFFQASLVTSASLSTQFLAGRGAVYNRRLPHQSGRAGEGRADSFSGAGCLESGKVAPVCHARF
jgi:hypothetical protein